MSLWRAARRKKNHVPQGQTVGPIVRPLLGSALFAAVTAIASGDRAAESQIKAAFLYEFGGFVEWPIRAFAGPDTRFTIGVLGADAVAAELEQAQNGRSLQGRPISVKKLRRGASPAGVHLLFIGQSESARLTDILARARSQPLLVVTEAEDGLARGSMINFITVDDKVRFDVALPQAERGELKISARLLSVARKVHTGP